MKKISSSLFILALILSVFGCGGAKSDANEQTSDSTVVSENQKAIDIAEISSAVSTAIVATYFDIKNALVDTNPVVTAEKATELAESLADQKEMEIIMQLATKMSSEKDIETQRILFSELSENLYIVVKKDGIAGQTVYKQFCPMAMDNEGAFWLSDSKEILNPYFGDKMLTCGKLEETIPAIN